ncbi:MAG: hypothetical protein ACREOY_06435 [Candidatus Dormibacteraceae bacterium]
MRYLASESSAQCGPLYPIIEPGPIPEHLMGLAQRAVDDCPVLAIPLRRAEVQRHKDG